MSSEAIKRGWDTRRAKYGPSGKGTPLKLSDRTSDDQYREKLKATVRITDAGCWEWQGYRHPKGYGSMGYRGKEWRVHRLAYTLFRGPIPKGMVICHTCDNRPCCNPLHLFLGTFDINNKDMAAKGRCKYSEAAWPTCKNGHPFTPENTYRAPKWGFRCCKQCQREHHQKPSYIAWRQEYQRKRRERKKQMQQSSES